MDRVLIVDDSLVQSHFLRNILMDTYDVRICSLPLLAIETAREFKPCLILMDIVMPKITGFELLEMFKTETDLSSIPVILISGLSDVGHEKQGLDLGAVDYIVKPYSEDIVKARVRTHVRIYTLQKSVEALMRIDALTGVYNRRYIEECCRDVFFQNMRKSKIFFLGMIDVDCFKQYNDCYGHLSGDAALRIVAQIAGSCIFGSDQFVARYGGEEFLLGLSNTVEENGKELVERIRQKVWEAQIPHAESKAEPVLTVSIGVVSGVPKAGQRLDDWIKVADTMLYQAKNNGRNQVRWTNME